MPITKNKATIQEGEENKEALTFAFTNGAKQQLEQLKEFFKKNDELEVLELAIGFLQKVKENEEQKKGEADEQAK